MALITLKRQKFRKQFMQKSLTVPLKRKYLVGVEVECELGVVLLDDDPGGLLHRLRTHATHLIYCNVCNDASICGSIVVVWFYTSILKFSIRGKNLNM
jgi:hypothetical protein